MFQDWICYEEIVNPEERAKSTFFDEADNVDSFANTDVNDLTVPLTGNPGEDVSLC